MGALRGGGCAGWCGSRQGGQVRTASSGVCPGVWCWSLWGSGPWQGFARPLAPCRSGVSRSRSVRFVRVRIARACAAGRARVPFIGVLSCIGYWAGLVVYWRDGMCVYLRPH